MPDKQIVFSEKAPAPIGPYSQAVKANGFLFISGQIALDADTGKLTNQNIKEETEKAMENLKAVLAAEGLGFEHLVKCSIFLSDMEYFKDMNEVYARYFNDAPPAREAVAVRHLPKYVNVEISAVAMCGD